MTREGHLRLYDSRSRCAGRVSFALCVELDADVRASTSSAFHSEKQANLKLLPSAMLKKHDCRNPTLRSWRRCYLNDFCIIGKSCVITVCEF